MFRRCLLSALCVVALIPCVIALDGPKGRQPGMRPILPGHRVYLAHRHGWHKVEYRVSAWQVVPAANRQTAQATGKQFRANGWSAQVVQPTKGQFAVKAKLSRWRLATYSPHVRTANAVAGLLRAQGYQARVR